MLEASLGNSHATRRRLAEVRAGIGPDGLASAGEDYIPGLHAIAAPVLDAGGAAGGGSSYGSIGPDPLDGRVRFFSGRGYHGVAVARRGYATSDGPPFDVDNTCAERRCSTPASTAGGTICSPSPRRWAAVFAGCETFRRALVETVGELGSTAGPRPRRRDPAPVGRIAPPVPVGRGPGGDAGADRRVPDGARPARRAGRRTGSFRFVPTTPRASTC